MTDIRTGSPTGNPTGIIRLGQYLKLVGLVATGGEAKHVIQQGQVQVNGQVETRRKRQLAVGDRVTLGGRTFVVELDGSPTLSSQDVDLS